MIQETEKSNDFSILIKLKESIFTNFDIKICEEIEESKEEIIYSCVFN